MAETTYRKRVVTLTLWELAERLQLATFDEFRSQRCTVVQEGDRFTVTFTFRLLDDDAEWLAQLEKEKTTT